MSVISNIKNKISFWVTNITNMNVSLSDLNLTIKAYSSVDLMDTKHYKYTIEQLNASVKNGSLYKKSNKIVVRKVAPEIKKSNVPSMVDAIIPSREKSIFKINQEKYEELSISDEEFAKENADLAELDSQPVKKV